MIPKIIHHTAPRDKTKWGPLWSVCLDSWYEHFPTDQYTHIFWTDEDLNDLAHNDFAPYWDLYSSFPFDIMKVDIARYMMLYKFGGLYVDMDYYCYKNFHSTISHVDLVMVQALGHDEVVQNAMMGSKPKHPFWLDCLEETKRFNYNYIETLSKTHYVKDITGPYFLSRQGMKCTYPIHILDKNDYNPPIDYVSNSVITRHMLTSVWVADGKDLKEFYKENRNVDADTFKF
jgi:mannosyltransferase OCH1-like enzyme